MDRRKAIWAYFGSKHNMGGSIVFGNSKLCPEAVSFREQPSTLPYLSVPFPGLLALPGQIPSVDCSQLPGTEGAKETEGMAFLRPWRLERSRL
jgi:hypothetical protein